MGTDFFILMKSELSLLLIIFILLFVKVWDGVKNNTNLLHAINVVLFINFIWGFFLNLEGELFSGMFYTNNIFCLEKNILNFGTLLISLQAFNWLKTHKHLLEFYILLLTIVLGMFYMISSGNFLLFYLGLELASIPLAALVNYNLTERRSSEAAIKLIFSSAFASGIMLFGISMLYGTTGSLAFNELPLLLTDGALQMFSLIFIFSGFAFKLSAVPFHFWTADVYEGAPVSVTAFLSVISKAATVFVFISVLKPLFLNFKNEWYLFLSLTIVLTILVGNLFAMRQNNLKRFLAFSSIAQVGYILFGLSSNTDTGVVSTIYFLIIYLFTNIAAFGVIALVSTETGKETIQDYKGFYKTNPIHSWVLAIAFFSLAGIPPTAGFFSKMFLISAGASYGNYFLVGFVSLNLIISLFYYLRVIKAIFFEENENPIPTLKASYSLNISLLVCFVGIVVSGFANFVYTYISNIF